jgi:hypothetical protein
MDLNEIEEKMKRFGLDREYDVTGNNGKMIPGTLYLTLHPNGRPKKEKRK